MTDSKTLATKEEVFHIVVKKLVSVKQSKPPKEKEKEVAVKIEKPLTVGTNNYRTPPSLASPLLPSWQSMLGIGVILSLFFGGIFIIVHRKKIAMWK